MTTQLVRISNAVEIPRLTYQDQPVLTFALIDRVHNRVEGTARKRFSDNRKRFIDGEDFFYVTDSESLSVFRTSHPDVLKDAANEITLLTESGYLMLVKSFTDDLSWQIQRQLVKLYFRVKEEVAQPPVLTAEERISPAQQAEIRQMAHRIGCAFTMKTSGDQAAFALVRESFGVPSAYHLPSRQFDDAMALLEDARRLADYFLLRKVKLEQTFLRSHFRASLPELNRQIAELESWVNRPSPLALRLS